MMVFLSTPSARRATIGRYSDRLKRLISIHALREEGDQRRRFPRGVVGISIHALREEGDKHTKRTAGSVWHFYPRPPRGGRLGQHTEGGGRFLFLSTPSARRATLPAAAIRSVIDDFYPRPPRGGRLLRNAQEPLKGGISIHALREEGDGPIRVGNLSDIEISIHALREEGDLPDGNVTDYLLSISIHALREEGDARSEFRLCITLRFLSTPSARRATVPLMVFQTPHTDFYPRPPRGGRQEPMKASVRHRLFLSTPSARRAT